MKDAGRQRVGRRILGFGTWCVALLVGTAVFHALGDGSLAPPPLDPSAWRPWLEGRDALVATMALLRLVVLGLCWYLVGVTTVGTIARLLRAARLTRLADVLTLPIVRRLLQQTLGVVLATTMVTAATGPSPAVLAVPAQVAADVGHPDGLAGHADGLAGHADGLAGHADGLAGHADGLAGLAGPGSDVESRSPVPHRSGVGIARGASAPAEGPPEVTLRGLEASGRSEGALLPWRIAGSDAPPRRDGAAHEHGSETPGGAPRTDPTAHTVRSGESLWRIARHRLEVALDRSPTDAEIVPYWREVIELNRDRLPDRDDPDLILPGQELLLPPVVAP
jgi:hypothetical protein